MSKKVGMNDEDYSYKNFWHNFNGSNYEGKCCRLIF